MTRFKFNTPAMVWAIAQQAQYISQSAYYYDRSCLSSHLHFNKHYIGQCEIIVFFELYLDYSGDKPLF